MGIVVSEKFYIGFQNRVRYEGEKPHWREQDTRSSITYRLGFATYLEDNAPFRKRKETITRWSLPYKDVFRADPSGRSYWRPLGIDSADLVDNRINGFMDAVEIPELQPQIIDNVPLAGFRIPEEIKRYGWNGGNVVWRVEDPRGFELEIPSANLAQILLQGTIENGTIQGRCLWGWDMGKVVLLPEDSEPFKKAMTHTGVRAGKIKASEVSLGTEVQLQNETVGTYLGRYNMLLSDHSYEYNSNDNITFKNIKLRSCFLTEKGLYIASESKISNIRKQPEKIISPEDAIQTINMFLQDGGHDKVLNAHGELWHTDRPILAFLRKPKEEDIELCLSPLNIEFQDLVSSQNDDYYDRPRGILFSKESEGTMLATSLGWDKYYGCGFENDKRSTLQKAKQGEILTRPAIFSAEEKRLGMIYRQASATWHAHDNLQGGKWITDANTREWLQPVIKFEGKEYPLIYIPGTENAG